MGGQTTMRNRWRDIRLVSQAVLITSALWLILFYLFGDKLPMAPAPADMAGAGNGDVSGRPAVQTGEEPADVAAGARGLRVVLRKSARPPVFSGPLAIPVEGIGRSELTDSYTDERGAGTRSHEALDIMADTGTPVVAAAAGTVEKLFWSDLGGNTVYVRSPDKRVIYYYAHLDAYRAGLDEGQAVRAGDPIGTVGSTGNADPAGPHLHFAILDAQPGDSWSEGTPVNPYPLLNR